MVRLISACALAALLIGSSAKAQDYDYDRYMDHLHHACDRGDRNACIHFGIEIGRHQDRYDAWHHHHPEFLFQLP
jgi:hypothetical protein